MSGLVMAGVAGLAGLVVGRMSAQLLPRRVRLAWLRQIWRGARQEGPVAQATTPDIAALVEDLHRRAARRQADVRAYADRLADADVGLRERLRTFERREPS